VALAAAVAVDVATVAAVTAAAHQASPGDGEETVVVVEAAKARVAAARAREALARPGAALATAASAASVVEAEERMLRRCHIRGPAGRRAPQTDAALPEALA
jgi:hypothetical protein